MRRLVLLLLLLAALVIAILLLSGPRLQPIPVQFFADRVVGTASPPVTIPLTNTGNTALRVYTVALTGTNQDDFVLATDACSGMTIDPNHACTIGVRFVPRRTGRRTATLDVQDNEYRGLTKTPLDVELQGTGIDPIAQLGTGRLTFGDRLVATDGTSTPLLLADVGTTPLIWNHIAIDGSAAHDFSYVASCARRIPPGRHCTIQLYFTPGATGSRHARLIISDNAGRSPQAVLLSGTGIDPRVRLRPAHARFGDQRVATSSAPHIVNLANSGTTPLVVRRIAVTGAHSGEFIVQSETCSGQTLAARRACRISIAFRPRGTGMRSADLTVFDNAAHSPQAFALHGNGISPHLIFGVSTLAFGSTLTGHATRARMVTVTSTGATPLKVSQVTVTGANASDFAVDPDTCSGATIAPHRACAIRVIFRPRAAGTRQAALLVADNVPGSPQAVRLRGNGYRRPTLAFAPTSLDFGTGAIHSLTTRSLTVREASGVIPLTIKSIQSQGTNRDDFAILSDGCSNVPIPVGGACTIQIGFSPPISGLRAASLMLVDNAQGSPQTVRLSGIGVPPPSPTAPPPSATRSAPQQTPTMPASPTVARPTQHPTQPPTRVPPTQTPQLPTRVPPSQTPQPPPAVCFSSATLAYAQAGTTRVLTITNCGHGPLALSSATTSGSNPADFVIAANGCISGKIAPHGTCAISMTFNPTGRGTRTASLVLEDDAPDSPQAVALSGTS